MPVGYASLGTHEVVELTELDGSKKGSHLGLGEEMWSILRVLGVTQRDHVAGSSKLDASVAAHASLRF
jgi:hypothetical protein